MEKLRYRLHEYEIRNIILTNILFINIVYKRNLNMDQGTKKSQLHLINSLFYS